MITLLFSAIFVFSVQTLCFKVFSRRYMKNLASYMAFNSLYFAAIVIAFAAIGLDMNGLQPLTLILGASFGAGFVVTIFLYMKAMDSGPLALSSLVFSLGLLVPILFGAVFWREGVSLLQGAALLLLFFTFWLGSGTAGDASRRVNVRWVLFGVGAMLCNGALGVLIKAHQMSLPGEETKEFLAVAYGTAGLLSLALFLWRRFRAKEATPHLKGPLFALLVLGTAATTAAGNLVMLVLSGRIPAVVQFPVVNGGIVFFSSVLSVVLFKERMAKRAWVGLALGLVALVIIGM